MLLSCDTKQPKEITILFTTDIHGALFSQDFNKNKKAAVSLSNVSSFVKQERKSNPDGLIVLDGGDFLQGQPSVYYSNFVDTVNEHIVTRTFDFIGYDAAAVGNHDIEPGEEVYQRLKNEFHFKWIAANAIDVRTGKPYFTPYIVINKDGLKVAVLGMITPNIHSWLPKYLWKNIEFEDMVETAQKWIPIIKNTEKPDLIIGLFHSGFDYEVNGGNIDTPKNENGGIPTAMKVDGFDILLLGHDHQERLEEITNNFGNKVYVINAKTEACFVGKSTVKFIPDGGKYKKEIITELVDMNNYPLDEKYEKTFSGFVDTINSYVDAEIGFITKTITSHKALFGPSEFMDIIHNAQLDATGADVSFAGLLSNNSEVKEGKITMGDLFSLYKYENLLYTMSLTGKEIKCFLEYGYGKQYNTMHSENDHLLNYKKDKDGKLVESERNGGYLLITPSFNFISAAGIKYTVDVSKEPGERVVISSMSDGSAFDENRRYNVAVNSYQASGGGGFFSEGLNFSKDETEKRIIVASTIDVRKYVADYIIKQKIINPVSRNDWRVIPENYFKKGMAKDMAIRN